MTPRSAQEFFETDHKGVKSLVEARRSGLSWRMIEKTFELERNHGMSAVRVWRWAVGELPPPAPPKEVRLNILLDSNTMSHVLMACKKWGGIDKSKAVRRIINEWAGRQ